MTGRQTKMPSQVRYTETEKQVFLKLLRKHQTIIECKKLDSKTIQLKREAWDKLTSQYNSSPITLDRTVAQMKNLWHNMRSKSRCSGSDETSDTRPTSDVTQSARPLNETIFDENESKYNPYDSDTALQNDQEEEVVPHSPDSPERHKPVTLTPDVEDELTKMVVDMHENTQGSRKRSRSVESNQDDEASPPSVIRLTNGVANGRNTPRLTGGAGPIPTPRRSRPRGANKVAVEFNQEDPDVLFLLSLAPMLRKLGAQRSSQFKIQVLQWLHDVEFG